MAVAAFSEDGKYYSYISKDGRLRIWETETNILKQEYTPDLHLTSPPICLQWITLGVSNGSQKSGKRNSISQDEVQSIALGTSSGKILIYSVTQAKVVTVLSHKQSNTHNASISALDWQRKYGLYSCNKSNHLCQWDLSNGNVRFKYNVIVDSKNKQANSITAIKIIPHNLKTPANYIVTASWQICLWRLLNDEATILRNLGHNTTAKALLSFTTLNGTSWLVEGSQNERLLSFWDITITEDYIPQVNGEDATPIKRQRKISVSKSSTPMYSFILEDAPKYIDVSLRSEDAGSSLQVAAATRSGVVHYYGHKLNGSSIKPIKPSVTIQVTSSGATPYPLQCCHLGAQSLLVGYTSGPATIFENVTPDLKSKTQILIRGETAGQTNKAEKKKKQTNEVNKVRSGDVDEVTYVEAVEGVVRKRPTPGGKIEVPMEARLQNLALDPKSRSKSAISLNLTKLLMQGLHSKDKNLILTVLLKDDPAVASQTVSHLPADYVHLLLEQLADMASKKTSQCATACTWLAATLRAHSALLLATQHSQANTHLAQLLSYFTHRRSHLCQLLNLKGRLELTMSQRSARHNLLENQEAILNYNDTSSDEEMEVEKYHSDSEHSWGDDKLPGESDDEKSADELSDRSDEMDALSGQSDDDD
ncbi:WD repeat-containing protein 43 [Aphomia sociella]